MAATGVLVKPQPLRGLAEASARGPSLAIVFNALGLARQAAQAAPPAGALALGLGLYALGADQVSETLAILLIYFGAQTGMNLYIKNVLSKIVVDEEDNLRGIPMGFLLTAIQQYVAFAMFCLYLICRRLTGSSHQVKRLTTAKEYVALACFSVTFALNIGLNNFSVSLIALSINMIIRSCLPLATAISQQLVGSLLATSKKGAVSLEQWVLMLTGVACAVLATYAKSVAGSGTRESSSLALGVTICVASIFSGAFNMVFAGVLGSELKLNPVDTTFYMALPAGLALLLPSLLVAHPMDRWPGHEPMTDWQVLLEVWDRKPSGLVPVLLSGVLALAYNILQYSIVHRLSASYATFAGNFNKAATVVLSLLLGLESLPAGGWGKVFLLAVAGNIGAFSVYSARKRSPK